MRRTKLLGRTALAILILSGVQLVSAPSARAVGSTTVVSAESLTSSTLSKTVTVTCPTGQFVYGPGAAISGGNGSVTLERMFPVGSPRPTQVTVMARVVGNFSGDWSVTAYAICGVSTTSLQVVAGPVVSPDSTSPKESIVRCPSNLRLYGTGFDTTGGIGSVYVHDIIPGASVSPVSVTVRATERAGYTGRWSLRAYGICSNPAQSMRVVQADSATDSTSPKSVNHVCPSGLRPHGVGVQTLGPLGTGTAVDGRIVIDAVAALAATVGSTRASEISAIADNWRLQTYVICAN